MLKHSATEIIHQVPTRWAFGISSVLCPAWISGEKKTELVIFYFWFLFSCGHCCFQGVSGRLSCACALGWLEALGWTEQAQKGLVGAGPGKLGITAMGASLWPGTLTQTEPCGSKHQRGAVVFSSNQKHPFPTAWRGWGHTPGEPPCTPKLHRRQR